MNNKNYKVYLAFYKAWNNDNSTFQARVIGVWTNGPYSHVELIIFDTETGKATMCSALGTKNTVRCKRHIFNSNIYDYKEINVKSVEHIQRFFKILEGSKYDYKGIFLSQIFPLGIDNPLEWFCSESCTKAIQLGGIDNEVIWKVKPESISPNDLAFMLGLIKTDKKIWFIKNLNLLFKKELSNIYVPFNVVVESDNNNLPN